MPTSSTGHIGIAAVGVEVVTNVLSDSFLAGHTYVTQATAPSGKIVIAGGFDGGPNQFSKARVLTSHPVGDPPGGWQVEVAVDTAYTGDGYTTYAVCVDGTA